MRKSRFTEPKIVAILNEANAGVPVKEVWRKHGISSATFYKWKAKYGGMGVKELERMKELKGENARLKRMYADLSLDSRRASRMRLQKSSSASRTQGAGRTHSGRARGECSGGVSNGEAVAQPVVLPSGAA